VEVEQLAGWGASIETPGAALRLTCEALLGRLAPLEGHGAPALLLHASEYATGIWVARGGRIQKGARLIPPVLIGPYAIVCAGARVGPGALIGARAIIERGAVVEYAAVEGETVVGEGLSLQELVATPEGLAPLDAAGPVLPLGDPLLLTRRRRPFLRRALRPLQPGWEALHLPAQEGDRPESPESAATDSGSSWMRSSPSRR
jgi:hypothetical protein